MNSEVLGEVGGDMDIDDIKKCFSILSNLGVKEVTMPIAPYIRLIKTIRDNSDDGGSHSVMETFDPPHCSIFGVKVTGMENRG